MKALDRFRAWLVEQERKNKEARAKRLEKLEDEEDIARCEARIARFRAEKRKNDGQHKKDWFGRPGKQGKQAKKKDLKDEGVWEF